MTRTITVALLLALAACSSVSGGTPLPEATGPFTPLNQGRIAGENGLVTRPTPGRSAGG